ncbi:MAG: hypothetical protein M1829_003013 [Trizodia sp. TS-e1964]|nr:MAG: hypothetical protein M1829_003013 [Trizodia sp. TS-e1964]
MEQELPIKDGHLDNVFSVFKTRQHPVVLVEESALVYMGLRVFPTEDLDLLIRDRDMEAIKSDLLATHQFKLVEQNLNLRLNDSYVGQVPRLRFNPSVISAYNCISLWSEAVYMLRVEGGKIEVPDPHALNNVLMEERYDLDPSWAQADSIGYSTRRANGVRILPHALAQSTKPPYPVYIPTLSRMLNALLEQANYRITHAENFPRSGGNRPMYHLNNAVRYLHLEKPQQQARLLPELEEPNRGMMKAISMKFKRKPLLMLADLKT